MSDRGHLRRTFAAMLAALVLGLGPAAALANPKGGNDQDEQRDTQSRNEQGPLSSIPLRSGDGLFDVRSIILIQTRFLHVTDTFSQGLGVDFENLDRLDVSDVPLLGNLFERRLHGEDFTAENRVGAVYRGADGTLVAVLDDDVDAAESEVSVVHGKGRYRLVNAPRLVETEPPELSELGTLDSVQSLLKGTATPDTTFVLGRLTRTSVPEGGAQVPLLNDIPILQRLFRGTVHRRNDNELLILIKPTVIIQDEEQ